MSRELVLVFLYDCDLCKNEEDDPQEAIIYFYPTWVSGEQRHALCSQLMGVTQFCTNTFASPSVISLQSGRFAIFKSGRYALCVGTDRNIPEVILRRRLSILYDLLRFFHCSIESINATLSDDDDNLSDRFSQLLQTYLPIALDGANPFDSISLYRLPKGCCQIVDEARQSIESLQSLNGVLGGIYLFQNKVIFTQLSSSLTKLVVLAHPYKVKLPACDISTPYHLPSGLQLLTVFVHVKEVSHLRSEVKSKWSSNDSNLANKNGTSKTSQLSDSGTTLDETCPDSDAGDGCFSYDSDDKGSKTLVENSDVPDLVLDAVRARQIARLGNPTPIRFPIQPHKKLKSKTTDDIMSTTNNIPMRYYSIGLPGVEASWTDRKKLRYLNKEHFKTICDPQYPLFKLDGLPASCNFYSNGHLHEGAYPSKLGSKKSEDLLIEKSNEKADRQLSLALSKYSDQPPKDTVGPLTPLMAKLTLSIAAEETFIDALPSAKQIETSEKSKTSEPKTKRVEEKGSDVLPLVMFVLGINASAVALLLEESAVNNSSFIHNLWEKSSFYLKSLDDKLDTNVEKKEFEISSAGEYSYAVVDPEWGPAERGGFHQPNQLEMLTVLHETLRNKPHISELLVREEDSVTYGYRCGASQVFYQQNCTNNSGVPTPADLMGVIPLKATSVLSRDHDVANA